MRQLLLRYGSGTQVANILAETDTRFQIRRIKKSAPDKVYEPIWMSKRDVRIKEGWGTDEDEGWTYERPTI